MAIFIPPPNLGNGSGGGGTSNFTNARVVFRENFTEIISSNTLQLSGNIVNGTFSSGAWDVNRVITGLQADVTDWGGNAIYDGSIIFFRNRIQVVSISNTGLVTFNYDPMPGQEVSIWYWYSLAITDVIDNYYREEHIASMEETQPDFAGNVEVNTQNFTGILNSSDSDVQKSLNTIDAYTPPNIDINSINGIQNPGGNINIVGSSGIFISNNDVDNTITIGISGISGSGSSTSGISGYSGFSGYSGYSGFSGVSGISGTSGFSGTSGISGFSGVSGFSGFSGFSGYSGFSGVSGFSGTSGFSGMSGFSGFSGVSGISGFSGFSGYSGTSGFPVNDSLLVHITGNESISGNKTFNNLVYLPNLQYVSPSGGLSVVVVNLSSGLLQTSNLPIIREGVITLIKGQTQYTITHSIINLTTDFPVVSLMIPTATDPIFGLGILNRTTTSFDIITSMKVPKDGYYLTWMLNSI